MIAPEGKAPIGIREGDIVELVGGTNGRLVGNATVVRESSGGIFRMDRKAEIPVMTERPESG